MADRKPFLLRVDRDLLDEVQRWADADLRSLNGQIEFLLRRALQDAGRRAEPSERDRELKDVKKNAGPLTLHFLDSLHFLSLAVFVVGLERRAEPRRRPQRRAVVVERHACRRAAPACTFRTCAR